MHVKDPYDYDGMTGYIPKPKPNIFIDRRPYRLVVLEERLKWVLDHPLELKLKIYQDTIDNNLAYEL